MKYNKWRIAGAFTGILGAIFCLEAESFVEFLPGFLAFICGCILLGNDE